MQSRQSVPKPPFSSMKRAMVGTPLPLRRLVNTKGLVPRMRLASRSITSKGSADMRGEIDLVDDQKVGTRDAGASLGRHLGRTCTG
jgi:hypothetical protein